jgi:phytoene dehydrogenase-like protein
MAELVRSEYDAIVIGGGHNGLIAAAYLARAKKKVLVVERRHLLGGCSVSEPIWPGYKVSTASYVVSLLLPEVIKELRLKENGLEILRRDPSSFTPTSDGRYLLLGPDRKRNQEEISKFSKKDAEAYPRYESLLEAVAEQIEPILMKAAPDVLPLPRSFRRISLSKKIRDLRAAWKMQKSLGRLGAQLPEAIELLVGAARPILERWFESDVVRATLATDAVIGAFASISSPGTAYVLLHHVMGTAGGARGVWGYVRGGMGGLADSIAQSCRQLGVDILLDAPVAKIDTSGGAVSGISLQDGRSFRSKVVASTVDCNLIERAYADALCGRPSERPILEVTMPTSVDSTVAPPGKHLISMFIQYAPYRLAEGNWDQIGDAFAQRCLRLLGEYAPNIPDAVEHYQFLSPLELERTYGLTGGNIFQGVMNLNQLHLMRPVAGWADHRTPLKGLYLCGAASHPGGGVMGSCGRNGATEILRDRMI